RERMAIHISLRAFLHKPGLKERLNCVRRRKLQREYMKEEMKAHNQHKTEDREADKELQRQWEQALNQLPEKCRPVFQLSRFEELKYQEIAERLNISLKTVEAHMGKALRMLRVRLADFLPLLLFIIPNL